MKKRKPTKRTCWDIRLARARQARAAARRRSRGWLLLLLAFAWGMLSPSSAPAPRPFRDASPRPASTPPVLPDDDGDASRPPSAYERGEPHRWRPKRRPELGRYGGTLPTLSRLIGDLRRAHARRDAADALMARLPAGDERLHDWVRQQLDEGNVSVLALWARPGIADVDIMAAWSAAAQMETLDEASQAREALTP